MVLMLTLSTVDGYYCALLSPGPFLPVNSYWMRSTPSQSEMEVWIGRWSPKRNLWTARSGWINLWRKIKRRKPKLNSIENRKLRRSGTENNYVHSNEGHPERGQTSQQRTIFINPKEDNLSTKDKMFGPNIRRFLNQLTLPLNNISLHGINS